MKAVVWRGIGDIRLEEVQDPKIEEDTDVILRVTASAICGTDLHMVRGTLGPMKPGTVLGHEAVGVVEEKGKAVRDLNEGDRVVVPSTIACGFCSYCRAGYYAQCDRANPNGSLAGTAFFGGPMSSGPFHGLQAERARIPFGNVGLYKLPDSVSDDQAVLLSDIFPTGWFGARLADIKPGRTVAVFGCGPVGQFTIASLKLQRAGRIFAVDNVPFRLEAARAQGAEVINFDEDDPVEAIRALTGGIGVDRAIDAVGVDANRPHRGPAEQKTRAEKDQFEKEVATIAPGARPSGDNWHPGDAPSIVSEWAVQALAKAGTLSIVGLYPPTLKSFPIGEAMNKNLDIQMGNCHHRRFIPELVQLVASGAIDPTKILTQREPLSSAVEAFRQFDRRQAGWLKVKLEPGAPAAPTRPGDGRRAQARP